MRKNKYQTKQMALLEDFLKSVEGEHVTANEIKAHFEDMGVPVGTATIYRNLERMVEEGTVTKYVVDGTTSACFEYHRKGAQQEVPSCYHCKCERCGKLIHIHCDAISALEKHVMEEHGFCINSMRTVFYGLCQECSEKEKQEREQEGSAKMRP